MTQSQQTVRLQANIENLVGNLKYAFSNPAAVLSELMQNARRAKASRVEFQLMGDTLIVIDDGIGISDMQALFSIAESNWDEATKVVEKPYGMGWLSCLYNAKSVLVESRGKRVEFQVSNALGFNEIAVHEAEHKSIAGTRLELRGFSLSFDQVRKALSEKAMGFAIEVTLDGQALDRPHALNTMKSSYTSVGDISIRGIHFGNVNDIPGTFEIKAYLQGLPIYSSLRSSDKPNVIVHLDSSRFFGVMPDRARLHDEESAAREVDTVIETLVREQIASLKETMAPTEWIKQFWSLLPRIKAEHLSFDVPYVPASAFAFVKEPSPRILMWEDGLETATEENLLEYWQVDRVIEGCISQESIVSGEVQIAQLPYASEESAYPPAYVIAHENRMLVETSREIPEGHWAKQHSLCLDPQQYSDDEKAFYEATPTEVEAEGYFYGDWADGKVVLAKSFNLHFEVNGEVVASCQTDVSFTLTSEATQPKESEHLFCIAEGGYSHLPHQVKDFRGEWDDYLEQDAQAEMNAFSRYVASLVSKDPAVTLKSAMEKSFWEIRSMEALRNRSFTLTIDDKGNVQISLQDTVATSE